MAFSGARDLETSCTTGRAFPPRRNGTIACPFPWFLRMIFADPQRTQAKEAVHDLSMAPQFRSSGADDEVLSFLHIQKRAFETGVSKLFSSTFL